MDEISRRKLGVFAAGAATTMAGPWRPARAQGGGTIKLGFTAALTGPFNEFGEGIRRGAELAVTEANRQGGILKAADHGFALRRARVALAGTGADLLGGGLAATYL